MVALYIQDTKKILASIILVLFFQEVNSQIIDCDQVFNNDEWEIIGTPEILAIPYGNFEVFNEKLKKETRKVKEEGKVFVRFVVDTLGNVYCAKAIKSDNELLNIRAIEIVEGVKFSPAMNRGQKVIAPMVLPITFGEQPKKEGMK